MSTVAFELKIESDFQNEADCLKRELKRKESWNLTSTLDNVIESNLSESENKTVINGTRNELRQDLINIVWCGTNETKFIESSDELFGIKNETLSALEQNYSYAMTTNDNDLLPLRNINLNPKNIATAHLNCDSIIRNEREDQRDFLRRFLRQYSRRSASCTMGLFNAYNVFDTQTVREVLKYVELPEEPKKF